MIGRSRSANVGSLVLRRFTLLAVLTLALPACNRENTAGETSGPMITTVSSPAGTSDTTSGGSSSSSSVGSSEGQSGSTTTPPPPDMPSFETEGAVGCTKLDFLFVLDNGPFGGGYPVEEFQKRSLEAIEGFTGEFTKVAEFDVHAMVVKSAPQWQGTTDCLSDCELYDTCFDVPAFPCWVTDNDLQDCDGTLGAGVVFPVGDGATNDRCSLVDGRRYVSEDELDFAGAFECVARVGNSGKANELRPAQAMIAALGPTLNAPDGCNDGFLRDDALLVVVLFHVLDDLYSLGTAEGWAASVIASKKGQKDAVVMVGIIGDQHHQDGLCLVGGGSVALEQTVVNFPRHVLGSICAPSFVPFFAEAIETVLDACDHFSIPQ